MTDEVSRWVEAAIAGLPREGRGRVLRTLRVSRCDDSIAGVERQLGLTRGRLERAERDQGRGLTRNELAAVLVHYRASMLHVWLASTLADQNGGAG